MTTQNYLMINTAKNIVENVCVWDGDTNTWQPPVDILMLIQADIPAKVWSYNADKTDIVLVEIMGAGGVGFTWDGTYCVTNEPKPQIEVPQPQIQAPQGVQ